MAAVIPATRTFNHSELISAVVTLEQRVADLLVRIEALEKASATAKK